VPLQLLETLCKVLGGKCCQDAPSILVEPRQQQQNTSVSNPDSTLRTDKKKIAGIVIGGDTQPQFCFLAKSEAFC
jgi:hypothetical protein